MGKCPSNIALLGKKVALCIISLRLFNSEQIFRQWIPHFCPFWSFPVGYPLNVYAESIPRTVQRLSLMGVKAELESVRIMGEQLPDLLHLHLDLCCPDICDVFTEMPQMFPKLQILKVRWELFVMNYKYIMSVSKHPELCVCLTSVTFVLNNFSLSDTIMFQNQCFFSFSICLDSSS